MAEWTDGAGQACALTALTPVHGGPDARGAAQYDFSTNSNACGPCPGTLAAVQQADATRYPDPAYTLLRARLAVLHGVQPDRIVLAASASEFIHRITAWAAQRGARSVALPPHSYGDYAQAAQARGLQVLRPDDADASTAALQWACEPSSPLGGVDRALAAWRSVPHVQLAEAPLRVLDCAYMPLRLHIGHAFDVTDMRIDPGIWQLWTPNKALGLTGVRAAYAIAPSGEGAAVAALTALAPSWPVGAHGVAMLESWVTPGTQRWLADCLPVLRDWKAQQVALCADLGWAVLPGSQANYFCARLPVTDVPCALRHLRSHGVQLRDCSLFALPAVVRLGVLAPPAQQALQKAWMSFHG